jgi:hypothetical protein
MNYKSAIFIGLLLIILYNSNAQTTDSLTLSGGFEMQELPSVDSSEGHNDTSFEKKGFSENDTISKWKRSRDFAYMHFLDSLLRKQKDIKSDTVRFDENSGKIIRNRNSKTEVSPFGEILNSLPFRIFFWILAVIFITFISYKVLFENGIFRRKKNKLLPENEEESVDDLQGFSEYDSLISDAETKHDFSKAIRFLFLKTLKTLSDREFISFAVEKTNQEYLKEMGRAPNIKEFEDLVRNYEFVWYGKHLISENQYLQLKESFNLFNKKI